MTRHTRNRAAAVLVALGLGFGIGLGLLGRSPVLAGVCPTCFGFREIAPQVYSELRGPTTSVPLLTRLARAEARVADVFGPQARPRILICYTETCNKVMGDMDARAMTYGSHLFYLTPDGHDTEIIAHELTHVALHRQIGLRGQMGFPAWLDEGIAVWVSRDPRFDLNPDTCDPGQGALPIKSHDWRHSAAARDASAYAQAGCRVAQWVKSHPVSRLDGLIARHLEN
ncbi:eCIS core domain-containing protein [Celeribacter halophilus]|uniref:eCIS core domain-containing protein n=1 Tax=Celeribacter halophilus TaxID=576117 RepID=UPI003A93DAE7